MSIYNLKLTTFHGHVITNSNYVIKGHKIIMFKTMQLHLPRRFEELQHNHVWGQVNQVQKCEKWHVKKGRYNTNLLSEFNKS